MHSSTTFSHRGYTRLNAESRLAGFGYINQRSTPIRDRRNALRRALQGGMTISEITAHLRWLIENNRHRASFRDTIVRWGDDIQWLEML
jgi:hypothetical protein